MTTKTDIREWIDRGIKEKATHLVVVCDSFDYEDYPVFVQEGQDPKKVVEAYSQKSMQYIMEVYWLKGDIKAQLNQRRSFTFGN